MITRTDGAPWAVMISWPVQRQTTQQPPTLRFSSTCWLLPSGLKESSGSGSARLLLGWDSRGGSCCVRATALALGWRGCWRAGAVGPGGGRGCCCCAAPRRGPCGCGWRWGCLSNADLRKRGGRGLLAPAGQRGGAQHQPSEGQAGSRRVVPWTRPGFPVHPHRAAAASWPGLHQPRLQQRRPRQTWSSPALPAAAPSGC